MPFYLKFEEFLNTQNNLIGITFSKIEEIIGVLPKYTFNYQKWWSNRGSCEL
ncbi:MAG: hypothetical protein H8D35_07650 [Nitrosopumilus sp.]|nr:hypothetical protein [Nitrosopumilus sp.]